MKDYYSVVEYVRKLINETDTISSEEKNTIVVWGYGHMGDGDLHIDIAVPGENQELLDRANDLVLPKVMAWVRDNNGSVGAEHGVGVYNQPYLGNTKSPEMISTMKLIKSTLDPNGIMNPYKIFP